MVEPNHFRVDYAINPFMDLNDQPEPLHTRAEWLASSPRSRPRVAASQVLPQLPDAPDMVYAMNLGLALEIPNKAGESTGGWCSRTCGSRSDGWRPRPRTTGSRPTASPRRAIGRDGVGAHFEAGDAFAWRGELVVGFGPRTEELALKHLATDLGVSVRGFRITHPGMYHMDLGFCPLDDTRAMVCPAAFDEASAAALLALGARAAGAHRGGGADVLRQLDRARPDHRDAGLPDRVRAQLEEWGFEVVIVEVGEFLKGGGAIRCMTNPLDVRLGRDLRPSPEAASPSREDPRRPPRWLRSQRGVSKPPRVDR